MSGVLGVDADGYLSEDEVRLRFARVGLPACYARRVIEAADSNQDGKISFAAILMFVAPTLHSLYHARLHFDKSGDDDINNTEIYEVLQKLKLQVTEKELELLLPKMEPNDDRKAGFARDFAMFEPIGLLHLFNETSSAMFGLGGASCFAAAGLKLTPKQQIIGDRNKPLFKISGSYELLARLSAGGIAAVVAQLCCQPIETVKVRLQNEANLGNVAKKYKSFSNGAMVVAAEEGLVRGLWKGMLPSAMRELSYSSLRFGLYLPIKKILGAHNPRETPFWKMVVAGGAAGGLGSAIANPCDILKIRMQADPNVPAKKLVSHMKQIYYHEGGITGFWKGVSTTVTRAVVLGATKLATYDESKIILNEYLGLDGLALQTGGAACAGFAYCVTTAPADFTRTRYMAAKEMAAQTGVAMQYKSPIDVVVQTIKKEGPRALYKGFFPQWARATPYSIVQFLVWEKLSSFLGLATT